MSEDSPCCYFHPREVVVGVCPLCLKERLLVLASKQGRLSKPTCAQQRAFPRVTSSSRLMSIAVPKVFALGSFLLRHRKSTPKDPPDDYTSSIEDSFISIKFGDDGRASWDKKHPKEPFYLCSNGKVAVEASEGQSRSVVEHTKPRGTLRWRRRVGHLLQVMRRRRSSKQAEPGKGRGWIRSLTGRRTTW